MDSSVIFKTPLRDTCQMLGWFFEKTHRHIGEFHEIISFAKPQEWQEFRLDILCV